MAEGTVSELGNVARIRVIAGGGPYEANFTRGSPSRLMIGSDPGATLRIERADVAPRQLDLIWDGAQLWVQDGLRLGRTFVNGRTLNEWIPIVGQALVCFGGVRLWAVAHTAAPRGLTPDFAALDRAMLNDAYDSECLRRRDTGRFTLPPELLMLSEPDVP
jgi:hypothetical protein